MNVPLRYDTAPIKAAEFDAEQQDFLLYGLAGRHAR